MQVRKLIREGFTHALQYVDVLVGPAAPTAAPKLGTVVNDPLQMYKNDVLTVSLNLAGTSLSPSGLTSCICCYASLHDA